MIIKKSWKRCAEFVVVKLFYNMGTELPKVFLDLLTQLQFAMVLIGLVKLKIYFQNLSAQNAIR